MSVTQSPLNGPLRSILRGPLENKYGGVWTPAQLTTTFWFDASDETTITESSGSVSQWDDKSGNGHHLTQGTGSYQPTTGTRTIGGLNALDFDGANDTIGVLTGGIPVEHSMFVVSSMDAAGPSWSRLLSGDSGPSILYGAESATTEYICAYHDGTAWLGLSANTPAIDISGDKILCATNTSTTATPYVDGVAQNTKNTTGFVATSGFQVCSNSATNQYFDGLVGEIIVIGFAVNDDIRQRMEGYLAWKWSGAL